MRLRPIVPVLLLCCAPLLAAPQEQHIRLDFGTTEYPSNGAGVGFWNDFEPGNIGATVELIDATGLPSGIQWSAVSGAFTGANTAGTTTPQPGSPLAEFPPSVTRDVIYGSNGATVVFDLTGFSPTALVDLTFAAARLNVPDVRTADYVVQGFNGAVATLDAANNTSQIASVAGILPDPSGRIRLSIRAAISNTNPSTHYFYLGGLDLHVTDGGTVPPVLGFSQSGLALSRGQDKGPLALPLTVLSSTGAPVASLTATDVATGLPPTWLSLPSMAAAGSAFSITADPAAVPVGAYQALIVAQAPGFGDALARVDFTVRAPGSRNLLFYGNSYSQGNGGMPFVLRDVAVDAGQPSPNVVAQLVGGQNLFFHLTDPQQAAAITTALPPGEEWDFVVLQGFSLEATSVFGNPEAFRANAVAIVANVRAHSPGAGAVLFQTWARGPGYSSYPGSYPGPYAMHLEIQANYRLAAADIDATFGPGTAHVAAAGDAVALLGFDPSLYTSDLSHPTPPTTLLTAMAVYEALYRQPICDVAPVAASGLSSWLSGNGLGGQDWERLSGIAERVADESVRRLPGSSEDLLLLSGVNAAPLACPVKSIGSGDQMSLSMTSPNGVYGSGAALLLLDAFVTGMPPAPLISFYPEVRFDPSRALAVATTPALQDGLVYSVELPGSLPGFSLLLQGLVVGASASRGNPLFTTTDAHELQLR